MADKQPPLRLITPQRSMRVELTRCFGNPALDRIDLMVSFIMQSGIDLFKEEIDKALADGKHLRVLTTDYLAITDDAALGFLLDREGFHPGGGTLETKIFNAGSTSFHPKAYLFSSSRSDMARGFVGSSNLSRSGIVGGVEWNIELDDLSETLTEFKKLWTGPHSKSLTAQWLGHYAQRREAAHQKAKKDDQEVPPVIEEKQDPPAPWSVQVEALAALVSTRGEGHQAGLVVMATGLGKTWLAAFDSTRPEFHRVLFVAHREEILTQARDTFRRIRPDSKLSIFGGGQKDQSGDVVFATIQSLTQNLRKFDRESFDYMVVDEFHHAAAPTYRRVINHFQPKFLLGLTATPDRLDQADLLALCGDNLIYNCGLVEGINRDLLCPFRYRAIRDLVDYEPIPWRGRFDEDELTQALATQERANQVLKEWLKLHGPKRRTLAFCSSKMHANFMARYFSGQGHHARSVHSGAGSDPRGESIALLEAGQIDILFSVDLFNEGLDVPNIDLVLMLRPTESPIIFLQQLGRGLRQFADKTLDVLDLVGNHRSFIKKIQILAQLSGDPHPNAWDALNRDWDDADKATQLPPGCSIIVDTEVIDLLKDLTTRSEQKEGVFADELRDWLNDHHRRATALETATHTGKNLPTKKSSGGWFGLLTQLGLLSLEEIQAVEASNGFLLEIEHGNHAQSFKLITYQALLDADCLTSQLSQREVSAATRWALLRDPALKFDLIDAETSFADVQNPTSQEWDKFWNENPLREMSSGRKPFFTLSETHLISQLNIPQNLEATFIALVREILDYRLHRYLRSKQGQYVGDTLAITSPDGVELNAHLTVESLGKTTGNIIIHSAGGTGENAINEEYVAGVDALLTRLRQNNLGLSDAYLETRNTNHLSIAERRLLPKGFLFPVDLAELSSEQLLDLRKGLLSTMSKVGRAVGARKGGGNSRRRFKLFVPGLAGYSPRLIGDLLTKGLGALPPPPASKQSDTA